MLFWVYHFIVYMDNTLQWHCRRKCLLLFYWVVVVFLLLLVSVLIHPFLVLLTPSTLLPTWHALPLMEFFNLMTWNTCPIRFRHLSASRDLPCSITLFPLPLSFFWIIILGWLQDTLQLSRDTSDTVFFSHDATPFPSNLIDMNDSAISSCSVMSLVISLLILQIQKKTLYIIMHSN